MQVREPLAFTAAEATGLLAGHRAAGRTALLLSTCNRTELYWTGERDLEPWYRETAAARGVDVAGALTRLDGVAAVRHLFTVVAGLDSQILGESEILGQVRRAGELARVAGTTCRDLEMIFGAAAGAGRRVRRETVLGRHPQSVSSASVRLGLSIAGGAPRVLVIGAGEAAGGVLRALGEHHIAGVTLVNRNADRARSLAGTWGVDVRPWGELPALLAESDLCFVATGATRPFVGASVLAGARAGATDELVVMDLAVPRNVDPEARAVPGVRLLDLDDLHRLACPASDVTFVSMGLARAEQILLEEMARLDLALRGRAIAPRLSELHRVGAELAERESDWALARLEGLNEREQQVVREMAQRLVRRVLYPVSRSIRLDDASESDTDEPLTA